MHRGVTLLAVVAIAMSTPVASHDACAKLDCQRLASKIERAEGKLRRKHSLKDSKRIKAELNAWRAEQRRFCRRYSR
ncbi:MAG: hypothetical protein AAGC71_12270 [Pseudomonadota bacterium]